MVADDQDERPSPKITYVIGGGAVKAMAFQMGVAQGLQEHGFVFAHGLKRDAEALASEFESGYLINSYIGSSAGAGMAAILANGLNHNDIYGMMIEADGILPRIGYGDFAKAFAKRWAGIGLKKILQLSSPLDAMNALLRYKFKGFPAPIRLDFVEEYFKKYILKSNEFCDFIPEIFITATQLNHTRKVVFGPLDNMRGDNTYDPYCAYYNDVDVSSALAASMSLPGLFAPYPIVSKSTGRTFHYYDGALKDTLSMHISKDIKSDFCIVSNIHIPYVYNADYGDLGERNFTHHTSQAIAHLIEQKVSQYRRGQLREKEIMDLAEDLLTNSKESKTQEFLETLRSLMNFRNMEVLYVAPSEDEFEFLFSPHFSFNSDRLKLGIEVGHRSVLKAIEDNPEFLAKLHNWNSKKQKKEVA